MTTTDEAVALVDAFQDDVWGAAVEESPRNLEDMQASRTALLAHIEALPQQDEWRMPEGWKLVPIDRIEAWIAYLNGMGIDVSDMQSWLSPAPSPPGEA